MTATNNAHVYTNKSNAARAAKKIEGATVAPVKGGFVVVLPVAAPAAPVVSRVVPHHYPAATPAAPAAVTAPATPFAAAFAAAGGYLPRGRCKALCAVAATWAGTRKEFVDAAVECGLPRATANSNYQLAYKKIKRRQARFRACHPSPDCRTNSL